jgi:hypothetical protein
LAAETFQTTTKAAWIMRTPPRRLKEGEAPVICPNTLKEWKALYRSAASTQPSSGPTTRQ